MNISTTINGKLIAEQLRLEIADKVRTLQHNSHITPGLAVILVGNHPASTLYVKHKITACKEVGINLFEYNLPETTSEKMLINKIELLNRDHKVHGILVQLPLPKSINPINVINSINPSKDVDGFTATNLGKLITEQDCFIPCTPQGCLLLIKTVIKDLEGLNALVVGRSNIVGKPMLHVLLRENCTVTIAHSYSKNLAKLCKEADILVAAVGKEKIIQGDWIKPGAIVIDVGISYNDQNKLTGDVDFQQAILKARAVSPVPGGVGPMTVACLLNNTLKSATKSPIKL